MKWLSSRDRTKGEGRKHEEEAKAKRRERRERGGEGQDLAAESGVIAVLQVVRPPAMVPRKRGVGRRR